MSRVSNTSRRTSLDDRGAVPRRPVSRNGMVALVSMTRRHVLLSGIVAAGVGGVMATTLLWDDAAQRSETRRREAADEVSQAFEAAVARYVNAFAGAQSLVDDGRVEGEQFDVFADGVIRSTGLPAVARNEVVDEADRVAWEARTGLTVNDLGASGFVPAPVRDQHWPVVAIRPDTPPSRTIYGFDVRHEPIRGAAAVEAIRTGSTTVSAPIIAQPSGIPGLYLATPLYRTPLPDEAPLDERIAGVVGLLTTAIQGPQLAEALSESLPERITFRILDVDANTVLARTSSDDRPEITVDRTVAGRTYRIGVDDGRSTQLALPFLVAVGSLVLLVALACEFARSWRLEGRREASARRSAALDDVLGRLARAGSTAEALEVISCAMPQLMGGADHVVLGTPIRCTSMRVSIANSPVSVSTSNNDVEREVAAWLLDRRSTLPADVEVAQVEVYGAVRGTLARRRIGPDPAGSISLEAIAELAEQALTRIELRAQEHRLVEDLLDQVHAVRLQASAAEVAAAYRPAYRGIALGGDWYDVIETERGTCLVVGDVSGHGVNAVADMLAVRSAMRALLSAGHSMTAALDQVERLLSWDDRRTATIAVATIDGDDVHYVCAGHPPPVVLEPGGRPTVLWGGRRPVLGASIPVAHEEPGRAVVVPGAVLALYTDGLVDRPGVSFDEALTSLVVRLSEVLAAHRLHDAAASVVDATVAADDVALLLARRRPAGSEADDRVASTAVGRGA